MKTYKVSDLVQRCGDNMVINYVKSRGDVISCSSKCLAYVLNHFATTLSHRHWLYFVYTLVCDSLDLCEKEPLHALILKHDLSKFSSVEALGYGLKFGRSQPLKSKREITAWDTALQHHYENNPHHPQFDAGNNMSHLFLLESIIDMLGCRMERVLVPDKASTPDDIFQIPDSFLNRYNDHDKEKVKGYLSKWSVDVTSTPHRRALAERLLNGSV